MHYDTPTSSNAWAKKLFIGITIVLGLAFAGMTAQDSSQFSADTHSIDQAPVLEEVVADYGRTRW